MIAEGMARRATDKRRPKVANDPRKHMPIQVIVQRKKAEPDAVWRLSSQVQQPSLYSAK